MFKKYNFRYYNFILLFLVISLMILGVFVIDSVNDDFTVKQATGVGIAIVIMIVLSLIDYHIAMNLYIPLYLFVNVLLVLVLVAGSTVNNATRWFNLAGITFQPSELAKTCCILFFAAFLSKLMYKNRVNSIGGLASFIILLLIPIMLIFREPDLSTVLCLSMVLLTMLFLAGLRYKIIGVTLLILIPLFSLFIWYIQRPDQSLLYEHQVKRIMSFIYPSEYEDETMQQENSVMAIGSGQLTGKGLAKNNKTTNTAQTNLISEQQTDFIFSAVGESFGFFGSVIIIGIILLIVLQCIRAGRHARDDVGMLFAFGMGCLIAFQSFINIGVATKLLPNTGIPLPFISYGLTSLISSALGLGIVLNISLQKRKY